MTDGVSRRAVLFAALGSLVPLSAEARGLQRYREYLRRKREREQSLRDHERRLRERLEQPGPIPAPPSIKPQPIVPQSPNTFTIPEGKL